MLASLRWVSVAAAVALLGCREPAPDPTAVVLGPPSDTILIRFSDVTRAVGLEDGRWAVVAAASGQIAIVDFSAGLISRLGGDSGTPRNPAATFSDRDTLYVSDWGLRQLTAWTTYDRPVRTIPFDSIAGGLLPQARDAAGRFYAEMTPVIGTTSEGQRDSAAIVRTAVTSTGARRADTVARLAPVDVAAVLSEQGRRFERRVFSGTDKWGVRPDGSVWVARVYQNRVDWRSPDGEWRKGQALPDRVLQVTRYDREMFIRNFPKELRPMAQQLPFAAIKPPFDDAFTAADGAVWLVKTRAPTDSAGRYHVVGRDGRLSRDLRLLGNARIVGASGDAVLAVESTREGARLLRFSLPPVTREVTREN